MLLQSNHDRKDALRTVANKELLCARRTENLQIDLDREESCSPSYTSLWPCTSPTSPPRTLESTLLPYCRRTITGQYALSLVPRTLKARTLKARRTAPGHEKALREVLSSDIQCYSTER